MFLKKQRSRVLVLSNHLFPRKTVGALQPISSITHHHTQARSYAAKPDAETSVKQYWEAVKVFVKSPTIRGVPNVEEKESLNEKKRKEQLQQFYQHAELSSSVVLPDLITRQLREEYKKLDRQAKVRFFSLMAEDFGTDWNEVKIAMSKVLKHEGEKLNPSQNESENKFLTSLQHLRTVLVPTYEKFLDHIIKQPNGMKFVVELREDLLVALKDVKKSGDVNLQASLEELSVNLQQFLSNWFSSSYLLLQQVHWNSTPGQFLEALIKSERVHPMDTWDDLKQRVGGYDAQLTNQSRRMYCFIHPQMSDEPIAFIQVAIMPFMPNNMEQILTRTRGKGKNNVPVHALPDKCAVFYSISSTQKGLQGIELGAFLIKRVVSQLLSESNNIGFNTFCTLSPIPEFAGWLKIKLSLNIKALQEEEAKKFFDHYLLAIPEQETIKTYCTDVLKMENVEPHKGLQTMLEKMLDQFAKADTVDTVLEDTLRPILLRLCSRYLFLEKKRGKCFDPVANFHIRNGAVMHRLNWMGDATMRGMNQSYGMMVNYKYVLSEMEANNQAYLLGGKVKLGEPFKQFFPKMK